RLRRRDDGPSSRRCGRAGGPVGWVCPGRWGRRGRPRRDATDAPPNRPRKPAMETMQALVKKEAGVGLWLDRVPVPTIGINDVLIRVLRTGICGTDVHIYQWDAWAQKTIPVPMVVGHEFVGEIVEVGSNVHDFHVGEVVSGEGHVV